MRAYISSSLPEVYALVRSSKDLLFIELNRKQVLYKSKTDPAQWKFL